MSLMVRFICTALVLAGSQILSAQHTRPTTAPAADLSTPRATLRALNLAMREGDVEEIRRLFLAVTPSETKIIEADAQMAAALADLRNASVKAFGADNAKVIAGDTAAGSVESLARIEAASITMTGDTASIRYGEEKESPFMLKKVDGEWKVPVAQLGKPLNPAALEQRISDLAVQRTVVREMAEQIRAGRFTSAERAREAWQSRILQAATSQPVVPRKE
jgi:hypothetical protein